LDLFAALLQTLPFDRAITNRRKVLESQGVRPGKLCQCRGGLPIAQPTPWMQIFKVPSRPCAQQELSG
jgi:hypothetical protein